MFEIYPLPGLFTLTVLNTPESELAATLFQIRKEWERDEDLAFARMMDGDFSISTVEEWSRASQRVSLASNLLWDALEA